jgi:hypothetical protein
LKKRVVAFDNKVVISDLEKWNYILK